jgi:hypothetical protein
MLGAGEPHDDVAKPNADLAAESRQRPERVR